MGRLKSCGWCIDKGFGEILYLLPVATTVTKNSWGIVKVNIKKLPNTVYVQTYISFILP